jgi:translation initiation factor IF-3
MTTDKVRQVKMRYIIDDHDFRVRVDQARRFLKAGDTVDVIVIFRGNEIRRFSEGREQLYRLLVELNKVIPTSFFVESPPMREGKNFKMTLNPTEEVL